MLLQLLRTKVADNVLLPDRNNHGADHQTDLGCDLSAKAVNQIRRDADALEIPYKSKGRDDPVVGGEGSNIHEDQGRREPDVTTA